jgi:hypothetical protein
MQKPRRPGSEAPNRKPLLTNRKTSIGHSKITTAEIAKATAGKLYRVRDKDWAAVWGENLSHVDAFKLKNKVVASRKSTTARVEDMAVSPPPGYVLPAVTTAVAGLSSDPEIAAVQTAALAAVRQLISTGPDQAYEAYAVEKPKAKNPYRDVTASAPSRPNRNPPRDQTVVPRDGGFVRQVPESGPPEPPQIEVTSQLDDPLEPGDGVTSDYHDLTADIGGGATDADIEHAGRQSGR